MEGPRRTAVASAPREGVVTRWLQASSLLRRQRLPWRPCGTAQIRSAKDKAYVPAWELLQARLHLEVTYPEPVALGRPFTADLKWEYTRVTTGQSYTFAANDSRKNLHTLSRYEIDAPNVVRRYQHQPFVIKGRFFDENGQLVTGDLLLVQCILTGPAGQYRVFAMQDNGVAPDVAANDGTFTGQFQFAEEKNADGLWIFFVIAQDINTAQPTMSPEQQAEIFCNVSSDNIFYAKVFRIILAFCQQYIF